MSNQSIGWKLFQCLPGTRKSSNWRETAIHVVRPRAVRRTIRSFVIGVTILLWAVSASLGQAASGLSVTKAPPVRSGDTIASIQVTVIDSSGNKVADSGRTVTLSLANAPGFSLSGTLTQTTQNGVATFSGLSLSGSCPGIVGLLISATGLPSLQSQLALSAAQLYVSTAGNDTSCGTSGAPFFTITHAAALVSPAGQSGSSGTTVFIAGGTYREVGAILPASSGDAKGAITFTHWPGDSNPVIIDGADRVTGWVPASTADGLNSTVQGVFKAPVSLYTYSTTSIDPPDYSQQVFIDGRMLPEAQYPHNVNHGTTWISNPSMIAMKVDSVIGNDVAFKDTVTFEAMPETLLTDPLNSSAPLLTPTLLRGDDNHWAGAIVHFIAGQATVDANGTVSNAGGFGQANSGVITSSTANSNAVTMTIWQNPNGSNGTATNPNATPPTVHNAALDISSGSPFYITGILSELSNFDEWEIVGSTLFLAPQLGHNPDTSGHLVEIKHRPYAFDLSNVSYITLSNINFFATSIYTNASSSNITLDTIHAEYVSHFSNFYPTYIASPNSAAVDDYTSHNPGWTDSGIVIAGPNSVVQNSTVEYSAGNGLYIRGDNAVVQNNIIHDVAYSGCFCSGISTGTRKISAAHNTTSDYTPKNLLVTNSTLYNSAGSLIQAFGVVGANFTHNELWGAVTHVRDMGAFYTNRNFQPSTLAYNIVRNVNYTLTLNKAEGQSASDAIPYAVNAGAGVGSNQCTTASYNKNDPGVRGHCDIANDSKGIYLDQGTSRWFVHHNLVFGSDWGIYNNYLADSGLTIGTAISSYNNTVTNTKLNAIAAVNNAFSEGKFDPNTGLIVGTYYLESGAQQTSDLENNLFYGFDPGQLGKKTVNQVSYNPAYTAPSTNPSAAKGVTNPVDITSYFVGPVFESQNGSPSNLQSLSAFELNATGGAVGGTCVAGYTALTCTGNSPAPTLGAFPYSPAELGYGWTAGSALCTKDPTNLFCQNITELAPGVTTGTFGSAPNLVLTPASASFAQTAYGSASASVAIAISNTGGTAATLGAPTTTGDFAVTANTCGSSLAAGAGCAISVAFQPTGVGTRTGVFGLADQNGPHTVPLSGSAAPATLYLTANNATRPFDVANPMFSASYSGFLNGDTPSVVSGNFTISTTANRVSPASNYSITVNGSLTAANYTILPEMGTLSITGAVPQSIVFPALPPFRHGATPYTLTGQSTSGLPLTYVVTSGQASISGNALTVTAPGSITVTAYQIGNSTYAGAVPVPRSFNAQ